MYMQIMGCQHSIPSPNANDWLFVHGPPALPPLCSDFLPRQNRGETVEFDISKNSWNKETTIEGVKIVPVDYNQCLLTNLNGNVIAVMKKDTAKKIRVLCSTRAKPHQRSCGEHYHEQPLYEWAVITRRKESHQYNMTTIADECFYGTEFIGTILFGPRQLTVQRQGLFCSTITRKGRDQYLCRVGPGVDPVLIVCLVVCMDKINVCEKKEMEAKHYIGSYRQQQAFPMMM